MLVVLEGRSTSLMFSRFPGTGYAGQLSAGNRSSIFVDEVSGPNASVRLQTYQKSTTLFCLHCRVLVGFFKFLKHLGFFDFQITSNLLFSFPSPLLKTIIVSDIWKNCGQHISLQSKE
jgi:hypothetical protein